MAINSLYSKEKYDIYVTGSNGFLLSADLATLFTRRYIEIHVFPFSFQEYCQYYDDVRDQEKLFDDYSVKGGLAGSYVYRTEKDRTNYIREVYETIVTRDLVQKYSLPDSLVLRHLSEFLMDNISNLTSPNKVSRLLNANETPTNHVTVEKYIKYLRNVFVFYDIKRYDIRGKKYLEKIYCFFRYGLKMTLMKGGLFDAYRFFEYPALVFFGKILFLGMVKGAGTPFLVQQPLLLLLLVSVARRRKINAKIVYLFYNSYLKNLL